jgi:hypothetical protein
MSESELSCPVKKNVRVCQILSDYNLDFGAKKSDYNLIKSDII